MREDTYKKALQADRKKTAAYYDRSLHTKTEQQKLLEKLLDQESRVFANIADIACGGGSLAYHLRSRYPAADFTLVDYNDDALALAKTNNPYPRFRFINDSIYELRGLKDSSFDLVCCWQTLSWIDEPATALAQLARIAQPGGKIVLSALFNLDKDVDLYTRAIDYTHEAGRQGLGFTYNTYSRRTVEGWLDGLVHDVKIVPFVPNIDFRFEGRGLGTSTITRDNGERLQVSGGMLLNWGILVATK